MRPLQYRQIKRLFPQFLVLQRNYKKDSASILLEESLKELKGILTDACLRNRNVALLSATELRIWQQDIQNIVRKLYILVENKRHKCKREQPRLPVNRLQKKRVPTGGKGNCWQQHFGNIQRFRHKIRAIQHYRSKLKNLFKKLIISRNEIQQWLLRERTLHKTIKSRVYLQRKNF